MIDERLKTCPLCGKLAEGNPYRSFREPLGSFDLWHELARHIEYAHGGDKLPYCCVCQTTFENLSGLIDHIMLVGYDHLEEHAMLGKLNR